MQIKQHDTIHDAPPRSAHSIFFYIPGMMPDWVRDALAWNPMLHAIDWFRAGFFASYQPHWLDRSYLASVAVLALVGGFAVERGLRRRLSMPL
ncbi:MAG TPA: hypothetical protein VHY35_06190 [Stellaceae bacterium]|jgi:capsular polysaccharide transport system permease protein|nr:hypothetical protein [Stellaceae bacterium]